MKISLMSRKSILFTEFREFIRGVLFVPFDLIEGDIFLIVIFRTEFMEILDIKGLQSDVSILISLYLIDIC